MPWGAMDALARTGMAAGNQLTFVKSGSTGALFSAARLMVDPAINAPITIACRPCFKTNENIGSNCRLGPFVPDKIDPNKSRPATEILPRTFFRCFQLVRRASQLVGCGMPNRFYTDFDSQTLGGERKTDYRNAFQIDRDRVIHSHSFRKLQSKTQVFLSGEYDFYRTRLTHSMEVA